MLTNRAAVWATFCFASRGDRLVRSPRLKRGRLADPETRADVLQLLDRLLAVGLIEMAEMDEDGPVWRVTDRGVEEADRTLGRAASVPACVMSDPGDWVARAWQSARIHRVFTAADLQATAGAPSTDAIRRWLNDLCESGHVREAGSRDIVGVRWKAFRMVSRDVDPPRRGRAPSALESDRRVGWRRRCWTACKRLGEAGAGFTSVDVAVAGGVSERRVRVLMQDLLDVGAIAKGARVGRHERGGRLWMYALLPDADLRAERAVRRDPWRQRAWEALCEAEGAVVPWSFAEAVGGVTGETMQTFLRALEVTGWVVAVTVDQPDRSGADPVGYELLQRDDLPDVCPKVPGRRRLAQMLASSEVHDG